jgi:hypothetical protein
MIQLSLDGTKGIGKLLQNKGNLVTRGNFVFLFILFTF